MGRSWVLAIWVLLAGLVVADADPATAQGGPDATQINDALGIGLNLGNALEAPREGEWDLTLEANHFRLIADAGFDHVRVPIRFSAYADADPPYLIPDGVDPTVPNADNLWARIDWVIDQAEANGLYAIIDLHHYVELHDDVAGHRDRFLAIWAQIATRYRNAGPAVLFELLNEPAGQFIDDPGLWNTLLADALAVVRETNPTRPVLVGPVFFNHIQALDDLVLPDDPNLIVSVHFYEPFPFTHQGAEWTEPLLPTPVDWPGDLHDVGAGWQNWSWDTTTTPTTEGLAASFERQWSGLQFARYEGFDPKTLELEATGQVQFRLDCVAGEDPAVELISLPINPAGSSWEVDLDPCPPDTDRIVLLVASETFADTVVTQLQVCDADERCERIIETGAERVESYFDFAAEWAAVEDRPLNVGEFGAYSAAGVADLGERAEWTEAVSQAARAHGMSLSYWEFASGFGAYDRRAQAWIPELVDALGVGPTGSGDVNCDDNINIGDALAIAQGEVGIRSDGGACPVQDPDGELDLAAGDIDGSGETNIGDALLIARCEVGDLHRFCPLGG